MHVTLHKFPLRAFVSPIWVTRSLHTFLPSTVISQWLLFNSEFLYIRIYQAYTFFLLSGKLCFCAFPYFQFLIQLPDLWVCLPKWQLVSCPCYRLVCSRRGFSRSSKSVEVSFKTLCVGHYHDMSFGQGPFYSLTVSWGTSNIPSYIPDADKLVSGLQHMSFS